MLNDNDDIPVTSFKRKYVITLLSYKFGKILVENTQSYVSVWENIIIVFRMVYWNFEFKKKVGKQFDKSTKHKMNTAC